MNVSDHGLKDLLSNYSKMTVFGLSPNPHKPSNEIPLYMKNKGWEVVGIYPEQHPTEVFPIYQKLADVPAQFRKFINVFRKPEHIPEVVEEVLKTGGTEVLWLQLGISHPEAEKRAEDAGLKVVSDRCLLVEHRRWMTVG